ncbi:hypothetical protein Poli38472_000959 [Pythium oligandrum]|uniref:Uncharacterized protein n=1 Tax=Pythium oligandrum TaxID=41045 RepID=A0A8K1FIN1_PYTOL|nr:hypothetical protein Poli38472_000959 [Pythium oligandrum]|eukprot:TMW60917.1 hypothetical protein Poli38472_000959 [Pythium oligandrum]
MTKRTILSKLWQLVLKAEALFERFQIELQGRYSVERLYQMKTYTERVSWGRLLTVFIVSMVPCLVATISVECIPLRPISEGLAGSKTFYIRSWIVVHISGILAFQHYRQLIPRLPSSLRQIWIMALVLATGVIASQYLCARWIGYPVPFLSILVGPAYMTMLFLNIGFAWGKFLSQNKAVLKELVQLQGLISAMFTLCFVYPVYVYFFVRIPSSLQPLFAVLLPIIKLAAKNMVSPYCKYIEDSKPEAVIFNVEIFHAYFVSICMQNSTSFRTTALLMLMDFVHAGLSLRDISQLAGEIRGMRRKLKDKQQSQNPNTSQPLGDLPAHVLFLLQSDQRVIETGSIRVQSHHPLSGPTALFLVKPSNSIAPMNTILPTEVKPIQQNGPMTDASRLHTNFDLLRIHHHLPESEQRLLLESLDTNARAEYAAKVLQLMHMVEFLVLIEFTEVIIPFVYSTYLYATFFLPNHLYHDQLRDVDEAELRRTLSHVVIYGMLELLSLLIFQFLIYRKIGISPAHQLGFVLEKQWTLVQLKLCSWFLFIIQFSMEHFGIDYTFKFVWLKHTGS